MSFQVIVEDSKAAFQCRPGESVLSAMSASAAACLPVGCRSGGCGVCRVQVVAGEFETGLMSAAQIGPEDREQGIALACQLFPRGDLRLRALGRLTATADDPIARLMRGLVAGHTKHPASEKPASRTIVAG